MIALAASLVLDQTAKRPVGIHRAKDQNSPGRRLGLHQRFVHLGNLVPDQDSHPLREAVVGTDFDLDSLSQMRGEEGTG